MLPNPSAPQELAIEVCGLYKIYGARAETMMPLVQAGMSKSDLKQWHDHDLALNNINLSIKTGVLQVVMGLSGSGKSTLIRHLNRLIEPSAGQIKIQGTDIRSLSERELQHFRRVRMAMVFQQFALMPHYRVIDNIVFGLSLRGVSKKQRDEQAHYWIERVGLQGYAQSYPHQLSGGMQQRVGLARALALEAPILLMDEAFSSLDPLIRNDMQSMLLDLQQEMAKTIVFITHDLEEALRLGDTVTILREGEIVQSGSAQDIVLTPADDYVADFVREVNRGRVIRCKNIMLPPMYNATHADFPRIDSEVNLEEAARTMRSAHVEGAIILSKKMKTVGVLYLADALSAMFPERNKVE
jgi:glycine betaine/proline transport system ATP-binding protein